MQMHILSPQTVGLSLDTSFGAAQAGAFRERTRDALSRSPRELLLDCSAVTYIDSTGLGLLALAQAEATKLGCIVKLANVVNPHVRQLLDLMQYDQMFPIVAVKMGGGRVL
jgi:anti-anti-sigma factor